MGRTAALNLRDSGAKIRIGNRDDEYGARAHEEGFEVVPLAAAATGDIVFVLLPDEVIPSVFATEVAPKLREGSAVAFASGACVRGRAFGRPAYGGRVGPDPISSRPGFLGVRRGRS